MFKEKLFNFIIILFFSILIIYTLNDPPHILFSYNLSKNKNLKNLKLIDYDK